MFYFWQLTNNLTNKYPNLKPTNQPVNKKTNKQSLKIRHQKFNTHSHLHMSALTGYIGWGLENINFWNISWVWLHFIGMKQISFCAKQHILTRDGVSTFIQLCDHFFLWAKKLKFWKNVFDSNPCTLCEIFCKDWNHIKEINQAIRRTHIQDITGIR